MTPSATAFTALDTLIWRLAVRVRLHTEIVAVPTAVAATPPRWEADLKRQLLDLAFSWPAPDDDAGADRTGLVSDTVRVLHTITQRPSAAERSALLDAWVEQGDAAVALALDTLARTQPALHAQWWEHLRLDRLLDDPEPTAHLVMHMARLMVTGAWDVADLVRTTRPWARSVGAALLQPMWATISSTASTASTPGTRAQAAACLGAAFAAARAPDADVKSLFHDERWRWHLVSGLARGADTAAGVALLDLHVPLPVDDTPLTPDHAARLLAAPRGLLARSADTLVALARRVPLPPLVAPTRFQPMRGTTPQAVADARAFAPLLALLGQAAIMAPMIREAIWQRATTADARVALLVDMHLTQRGPWWGDPVFVQEAFLALRDTAAPDAVFVQEEVFPALLAEQWGHVPLDLWLAVSLRAVPAIEDWIATIAPRVAWGLPLARARTEDLLPLLQHPDARVRVVGQSLLAHLPRPPRVRR